MPKTASSALDAQLVGESLREARKKRRLTQADLAARLGVSAAYVQKVEAGRANPTLGQLATFAAALDATLEVGFAVPAPEADPLAALAQA